MRRQRTFCTLVALSVIVSCNMALAEDVVTYHIAALSGIDSADESTADYAQDVSTTLATTMPVALPSGFTASADSGDVSGLPPSTTGC